MHEEILMVLHKKYPERKKPHFICAFPWCAVVSLDDQYRISCDKIEIFSINSPHLLNLRINHYKQEGFHIVDLSKDGDLYFPVPAGDEWIFQDNVCEWCGGPFSDNLSAREKGKRIFCCNECKQKFRNFERIYSRLLKEGKITDNIQMLHDLGIPGVELARLLREPCLNCGNPIPDDKPLSAKFCSDKCRYEYHNKMKKLGN